MRVLFSGRRKTGHWDLEAVEIAVRSAMHQAGAAALSELLQWEAPAAGQRSLPCSCGHQAQYRELRSKSVLTAVGRVHVSRPYYLCGHCHRGQFPADAELDIVQTECSPGVRRMQAVVGQQAPFDHGRRQLELLAGLQLNTRICKQRPLEIEAQPPRKKNGRSDPARSRARVRPTVARAVQRAAQDRPLGSGGGRRKGSERISRRGSKARSSGRCSSRRGELPLVVGEPVPILYIEMDGTGIPVVSKETAGRAGKRKGEPAHTREAKLGCVFTQTKWDEQGYPIRDADSTTYCGAIETADEFGKRIYVEAWKRGWSRARKKVVLGDGAEWIWNLAQQQFPGAIQIVDLYHARQHLWDLARQLHPHDKVPRQRWITIHQDHLDQGKIEELVRSLRSVECSSPQLAEEFRDESNYFEKNAKRMRYPEFRRQHLFVGSGVIEAGCKSVIGSRLKQSGMFWTVRGANAILALRCCHHNGRFEDYWEARAA